VKNYLIKPTVIALVTSVFVFSGNIASAQRSGQSMTVQTGVVIAAQAVNLQSQAGRGAVVGGIVGYATTSSRHSSSRRVRNTAIGAGTGALISRRAQGSLNGMQYTVEIGPGTRITVVTDQTQVRVGDCVNVEQAGSGTANVRRVSEALCDAVFSNQVDEEMQAYMDRGADMCLQAKDRMMDAETDEAFETAMRRVKFLCDD
jgi:outer membrane lipoprotein SlyB